MAAPAFIALDGPGGQAIYVNPAEVVSIRAPNTDLLPPGIKCSLQMADGKLIHVVVACDEVLHRIERADE